jgi:hypothetical protein
VRNAEPRDGRQPLLRLVHPLGTGRAEDVGDFPLPTYSVTYTRMGSRFSLAIQARRRCEFHIRLLFATAAIYRHSRSHAVDRPYYRCERN